MSYEWRPGSRQILKPTLQVQTECLVAPQENLAAAPSGVGMSVGARARYPNLPGTAYSEGGVATVLPLVTAQYDLTK